MTTIAEAYYQRIRPLQVRNDSGEVIPAFSVLRITGTVSVNSKIVYKVDKPNTTFERRYLVNGPVAIPVGKYGFANDGRFVDVEVDYTTAGKNYGPSPGSWKLVYQRYGFELFDTPSSSQKYRAIHEPISFVMGVASSGITAGGSGTMTVRVNGTTAGPWSDITVYHDFLDGGTGIASGDELFCRWFDVGYRWRVVGATCA
jgi:hypothetical protein